MRIYMRLHDACEIDIANVIAIAEYNVVLVAVADKLLDVFNRAEAMLVQIGVTVAVRRKNNKPTVFARQVPVLAAAHVVHKRLIIVLGNNADLGYSAVYHVGQHKVYKPEPAAEWHRSDRPDGSQLAYISVVKVAEYYSECFHYAIPPLSTISAEPTFAPRLITEFLPTSAM